MSTRRERAKALATKLNKQLVAAEEATCAADKKRQVERSLGLWRSELFTDMAKLIFAGVILGGVFEKVENPMLLYGAGTSALIILLIMGYYFLKQALKK